MATIEEVKNLHHDLGNKIYAACAAFELAEMTGVIDGNGHHIAQKISMAVQNYFRDRVTDPEQRLALEHKGCWSNDLRLV